MKREQIVLPADVYDTLEFSALAWGGIGAGSAFDYESKEDAAGWLRPLCVYGHEGVSGSCVQADVQKFGLNCDVNDEIVRAINHRRNRPRNDRVGWKQYVREGNIVRGAV